MPLSACPSTWLNVCCLLLVVCWQHNYHIFFCKWHTTQSSHFARSCCPFLSTTAREMRFILLGLRCFQLCLLFRSIIKYVTFLTLRFNLINFTHWLDSSAFFLGYPNYANMHHCFLVKIKNKINRFIMHPFRMWCTRLQNDRPLLTIQKHFKYP